MGEETVEKVVMEGFTEEVTFEKKHDVLACFVVFCNYNEIPEADWFINKKQFYKESSQFKGMALTLVQIM